MTNKRVSQVASKTVTGLANMSRAHTTAPGLKEVSNRLISDFEVLFSRTEFRLDEGSVQACLEGQTPHITFALRVPINVACSQEALIELRLHQLTVKLSTAFDNESDAPIEAIEGETLGDLRAAILTAARHQRSRLGLYTAAEVSSHLACVELVRYLARHGKGKIVHKAKAALAIP